MYAYRAYQEVAQALADGEDVDDDDLENLRYVRETETGQEIVDAMAVFDVGRVSKLLATGR